MEMKLQLTPNRTTSHSASSFHFPKLPVDTKVFASKLLKKFCAFLFASFAFPSISIQPPASNSLEPFFLFVFEESRTLKSRGTQIGIKINKERRAERSFATEEMKLQPTPNRTLPILCLRFIPQSTPSIPKFLRRSY